MSCQEESQLYKIVVDGESSGIVATSTAPTSGAGVIITTGSNTQTSVNGAGLTSTGSTSGNSIYIPSTTIPMGPIYPSTGTGTGMYTYPNTYYPLYVNPQLPEYVVLKLPNNKIPDMVFVNGLAKTIGLIGSKADVAVVENNLIISSSLLSYHSTNRFTFILQYKTHTYHIIAFSNGGAVCLKPNSNIIDSKTISIIKRA